MPPKKLPQRSQQQKQQSQSQSDSDGKKNVAPPASDGPAIPEEEVKKNSSLNAHFALEATKKAYELRQAAYGAGDPNAREQILAKAINKEIEAESFGKAAKYTRSGAFQGLAAGAGLGVQPGVTLGQITGALVGGLLSSVGAVLGGGVGAAYGAMSGPFWDLGQMASQGVRSIVGDFPNWEATSSQKKALEKMVLGAQQTKKPSQEELEQMRDDNGGITGEDYQQFHNYLTSWIPSMPSMPNMPSMPSMGSMPSIPRLGGQPKGSASTSSGRKTADATKPSKNQQSSEAANLSVPPTTPAPNVQSATTKSPPHPKLQGVPKTNNEQSEPLKNPSAPSKPQNSSPKPGSQTMGSSNVPKADNVATKSRPRKLDPRSVSTTSQSDQPVTKRKPPKLQQRPKSTTKA